MKLKRMAGAAAVLLLLAVCTGALAADTGIITAEGVNLRESPDKESNAIGTLELGSEVEVLAVENGWYRIMLKSGTVGYIRQDYIFSNSSGSRGAYVLDDGTYIRGGPSEDTYAVKQLTAGKGVRIKAVFGEWFYVVADDATGYVYRTHLTLTGSNTASGSMLRTGMEGEEVERLQKKLYDRGFMSKRDMSGVYDSATRKAVLEYQKKAGLSSADGIAGAETLNSVFDSTNKLTKENATFTKLKGSVVLLDWFKGGSEWLNKGAKVHGDRCAHRQKLPCKALRRLVSRGQRAYNKRRHRRNEEPGGLFVEQAPHMGYIQRQDCGCKHAYHASYGKSYQEQRL